jgi:xanthine dehydrogenase accessory factor
VVGNTPVAEAVVSISAVLGYASSRSGPGTGPDGAVAVIIASHGRDEHDAITAALAAGVPYIALVASPRRGRAVLDELDLSPEQRARISTPAGLDIGARTAPEVALSILAEVITAVRSRTATTQPPRVPNTRPRPGSSPSVVVDPVCGMSVTVMPDTAHLVVDGTDFCFCSEHCRHTYAGR